MILASARMLKKATSIVLASLRDSRTGQSTRHHFARCGLARGKAASLRAGDGWVRRTNFWNILVVVRGGGKIEFQQPRIAVLRKMTNCIAQVWWRRLLVILSANLLVGAFPAHAFTLSAPKSGTIVGSGEPLSVSVETGKDANLRGIKFYWYRAGEEPIDSHQAEPASFIPAADGPPFAGSITVPADAMGVMRLLAVGEVTRGRLGGHEDFDEVLLTVQPKAALTVIEFAVQKPWRLTTIGKRVPVPAVGQFADEEVRLLTGPGTESEFRSSDERVVSVDPEGIVQVMGNGKAVVTVKNRGKEGLLTVLVDAEMILNHEPVARVPAELTVKSGHLVVLDGIQSRDPDGDPLHYEWKQLSGNKVALMNSNEAKATFMAPTVAQRRQFQFSLQVTDMAGPDTMKGADSRPAIISVWVEP
jgi:K319-like protein